jgi:2-polyprenyl-6-methoxyphenol hydroxylase-like FAD-dependent oxidoreductase
MANSYDLIVVGAGSSGLLAAKAAAEAGLSVAVLDKKKDPNKLVRACGQTLISMNEPFMGNICYFNERDHRVVFPQDGFSFKYEGPYQNMYNLLLVTNDGHVVTFGDYQKQKAMGSYGRVGCTFDKEYFFEGMINELKKLGVKFFGGVNVAKAENKNDHVVVEGSDQSFQADYVIAADGANSRVAASLGMNEGRYFYCVFYGISHYVTNVHGLIQDQVVRVSAHYLKDGAVRTYIVPRPVEGEFNVIMVTIDPRSDLKAATPHIFSQGASGKWLKDAKIKRSFSAAETCWTHIDEPVKGRVIVVGDAAATQETEITGAMMMGWKAGSCVASALIEGRVGSPVKGLEAYSAWWQASFNKPYPAEAYMKGNVFPYILTSDEENNYVYGKLNDTFRASWNPYGNPTQTAMAKAIASIEQERPELAQKLARRKLPAKELLLPITQISKPITGE